MHSFIAWALLPTLALSLSLGLGLLTARLARVDLPWTLLAPVGAALAVVLATTGYVVGVRGVLTPLAIAAVAAVGLVLGVRDGRAWPRSAVAPAVWAGTYGLYIAPVVLSGHWTWTGYNFVNDTSIQLLIADWLPDHGRTPPPQMFVSTSIDALVPYLSGGYPVGAHSVLAALHELIPIRQEALYQPLIATFAGLGAMAIMVLVQGLLPSGWAAFAAFTAVAGNLLYQYALQGNMKEIVAAAMLMTAAAVAAWSLRCLKERADPTERRRVLLGSAIVLALPVSAMVHAFSTAGGPYVMLVVLLWLGMLFAHRLVPGIRALALSLAAGAAVLFLGTLVTLTTVVTFGRTTSVTYADPGRMSDLGHLARPLEVRQTAGIWLTGDYRFAPTGLAATLTTLGIVLVGVLAAGALMHMVRRRRFEPLLLCVPVVLLMLLVTPRVSPYADAKTFMLMAPAVTLLGAIGAWSLRRVSAPLAWVAASSLLVGVLASNAFAYHSVQLAPTDRMKAIRDLDRRFEGEGLILFNEPEEFAKNFMQRTLVNVGAEAVTPKQSQLRVPQSFAYLWFDLDDLTLEYVLQFPYLALRRSPVASRPPASFGLVYSNEYYEVWRRRPNPRVLEHLPLQAVHRVALEPSCADLEDMADRAASGERLAAATPSTRVMLDTVNAERTASWRPHPFRANMVITGGPGEARTDVRVTRPGRYRAWVAGSFGRPIEVLVDGRRVGEAVGVNTVGQWHQAGTVTLDAGRHELKLRRGGGGLAPGDGFSGELGPLVLERVEPTPLVEVEPEDVEEQLCGRSWDWVERIKR